MAPPGSMQHARAVGGLGVAIVCVILAVVERQWPFVVVAVAAAIFGLVLLKEDW